MIPTDVIRRKRDGGELPDADIEAFLNAYTAGTLPDYQMSALAMAVYFQGLTPRELDRWTSAMLHSGEMLDLSSVPGRKVDKHSTGGVGDKLSLTVGPLAAACGLKVPMIAGRGLGHTGGTLDKLEAIPGMNVRLDADALRKVLRDVGCCIVGQTEKIAPADKKLYSLRDVTATVESIPLIASSIMSKKLASGTDALVLDVKFGSGAFMREYDRAKLLAQTLVGIGRAAKLDTVAYLTNMEQPLGREIGNASEIVESVEVLRGGGPADVVELTLVLASEMLVQGHLAKDIAEARAKLSQALQSGAGVQKLAGMVAAQGGDASCITDPSRLPKAKQRAEFVAPTSGYVGAMQTDEIGRAAMILGAGRQRVEDRIDPAVGLSMQKQPGDKVDAGDVIAVLHVNDTSLIGPARLRLQAAIPIVQRPPPARLLVAERIA
jgi:pyrimidine-nucleoside phosphorylase